MSKENNTHALPAGFIPVSTGEMSKGHDFEKNPEVQGSVVGYKTVEVRRGKKFESANMMKLNTDDGLVVVWESAALEDLFTTAKPGDMIYIKFIGMVDMGDSRQAMKNFVTAIAPKVGGPDA